MVLFRISEGYITKGQKRYKEDVNVKVNLDNFQLIAKDQFKYLGVIFQKKCSVIPHIDMALKKGNGAYSLLGGVFRRKGLSIRTKEICYKQLIKPIMQYGFPGWCSLSSRQMGRIRSLERKVLYKCLPPNEAYTNDNLDNCYRLIHKKDLYNKFKNFVRIDANLFKAFSRHMAKLEYISVDRLKCICNLDFLNGRYSGLNDKFIYKSFSPSFLYKLFLEGKTSNQDNIFTFYNRRYNSNNLDEYVYDLAEPD